MKRPLPTWLLCVWRMEGFPVFHQVDKVDAMGVNHGSTNPAALISEGYILPDIRFLPHGQYRFDEIAARAVTA